MRRTLKPSSFSLSSSSATPFQQLIPYFRSYSLPGSSSPFRPYTWASCSISLSVARSVVLSPERLLLCHTSPAAPGPTTLDLVQLQRNCNCNCKHSGFYHHQSQVLLALPSGAIRRNHTTTTSGTAAGLSPLPSSCKSHMYCPTPCREAPSRAASDFNQHNHSMTG